MGTVTAFEQWTRRGKWGNPPGPPGFPLLAYVVHHSVTDVRGDTPLEAAREVEEVIYGRRISARFSMVAYCELVDNATGDVFVGRGADHQNGANNNTRGVKHTVAGDEVILDNSNTYSGCLMGNYHPNVGSLPTMTPSSATITAIADRVEALRAFGILHPQCVIIPHRELHATACPGDLAASAVADGVTWELIRRHALRLEQTAGTITPGAPMTDFDKSYARAIDLGITGGSDPHGFAERDEAAVMAVRALEQAEEALKARDARIDALEQQLEAGLAALAAQLEGVAAVASGAGQQAARAIETSANARADLAERIAGVEGRTSALSDRVSAVEAAGPTGTPSTPESPPQPTGASLSRSGDRVNVSLPLDDVRRLLGA